MARRRRSGNTQEHDGPPRLRMSVNEARRRIGERLDIGRGLIDRFGPSLLAVPGGYEQWKAEYDKWNSFNHTMLRTMFDSDEIATEYDGGGFFIGTTYDSREALIARNRRDLQSRITKLEGVVEQLSLHEMAPATPAAHGEVKSSQRPLNISIHGSTIGTMNLGEVLGDIDTHVNAVAGPSAETFRAAISKLAQAVARDAALEGQREAALEHLDQLVDMAEQPPEKRKLNVVRSILATVKDLLSVGSEAADALEKYGPDLTSFLGV